METVFPLLARAGRVLTGLGVPDSACHLLATHAPRLSAAGVLPSVRADYLATWARAEWSIGDRAAARRLLGQALDEVWTGAYEADTGAESYLALAYPTVLREALIEQAGLDASASYRSELALRGWVRALGGRARSEPPARWRWAAIEHSPRLRSGEAHLLFAFVGERLCRWFATPAGVTVDTLAGDAMTWRKRVAMMQQVVAAGAPARLDRSGPLRSLSRDLLPARLWSGPPLKRLYWSPAGPLAAIPVEALDVGEGDGYEPLASRTELATLRGRDLERDPGSEVAVLASPALSARQQRLFPQLGPLQQSLAESEDVRARWPRARVLTGRAATEPDVLASWDGAGLIHIAAHLVRQEEIPYYDFIPLAPAAPENDDATLEVADVRRCDLSHCELVVLSTCASGRPYIGGRRVGPSMADAFLDAGARSVLRSLRPVEDRDARRFVSAYLAEWQRSGHDAIAAARATRIALSSADGGWSPTDWATWSVAVNVPYREGRPTLPPLAVTAGRDSLRLRALRRW
jgi:hypothetical protein